METNNLILIEQFCTNCNVEFSLIDSLHEFGLVEIIIIEDSKYISQEQLKNVEKMVYFHKELHINLEGIDVISNLLTQINILQQELKIIKNKLKLFDTD